MGSHLKMGLVRSVTVRLIRKDILIDVLLRFSDI